ncbi:hypothetical protein [Devosia sp.]|uniref:hypothetical protein n=1 Tax=Devosia sp. TaxID=1871048 RepID=UPI002FCA8BEC
MTNDLDQAFIRIEQLVRQRALPGVARATSNGTPALKVLDNSFAHLLDATTLVLQCPPDQKALLMEISPDIYFETDPYVGQPAVLIHLDAITDEELSLRLEDAWFFESPPSLAMHRAPASPKAGD